MLKDIDKIPEHIFRAYDIRGTYPDDLNESVVFNIGVAFGAMAQQQGQCDVFIARDGRLSGPVLLQALSDGLRFSGCNVTDIGAVPTPVLYFAAKTKGSGTGIMLTGSHNPANYNGLKMMIAGQTLAQQEIQDIKFLLLNNQIKATSKGHYQQLSIEDDYIDYICHQEKLSRPLKMVIDAGNGIAGDIAPKLFKKLGCEVIPLFCEVDGHFPNHHPDPSKPQNLEDLIAAVKKYNADVGLAFDGDGDRLGVITPKGDNIFPDRQLMLYAKEVIDNKPGATILYDVKCTKNLADFVEKLGGKPVMYKTGHALIKKKIQQIGADLAGEMSGHTFFNDRWLGFDDGLYTGVRLLSILSQTNEDLDQLFATIPQSINTPEINIQIAEKVKFAVVEKLSQLAKTQFQNEHVITIDGVRVEFCDGWGLVRASNTTPCLVLRFEADSEEALKRIQTKFTNWVQTVITQIH
ncbi:phosphomannomutase/phosphoglucomutase [Facilibium subflavum]|uniref:phosphomannomutase/phosphoglucomutase n=1 Tax=Facilibium subflavum TaxID=2219058 RepID=UPI000E64DA3B|nr:phosphomannomutase/phosphoglucomutase [Facilibium subflavum]